MWSKCRECGRKFSQRPPKRGKLRVLCGETCRKIAHRKVALNSYYKNVIKELESESYSSPYQMIITKLNTVRRPTLTFEEATSIINSIPNLNLPPGTTTREIIGNLQRWRYVDVIGNRIIMKSI